MPLWLAALTFTACGGGAEPGTAPSTVTAPSPSTSTGGTTTTSTATVAYVQDIKPILDSDCVMCHGPSIHESGVRLDTYANVMREVQAGNSNSVLVRQTRSNGPMYVNFTGNRAAKSEAIRAWVVDNRAIESR